MESTCILACCLVWCLMCGPLCRASARLREPGTHSIHLPHHTDVNTPRHPFFPPPRWRSKTLAHSKGDNLESPTSLLVRQNGKPANNAVVFVVQSITGAKGVPQVPAEIKQRALTPNGGQGEVEDALAKPPANMALPGTVTLTDFSGGGRRKGRARRDTEHSSDGGGDGANTTSVGDSWQGAGDARNDSSITETPAVTSSLSSVSSAGISASSSETLMTTSNVSSSQEFVTSDTNVTTDGTSRSTTTSTSSPQSSSSPQYSPLLESSPSPSTQLSATSAITPQDTSKAAETSTSKLSSDDVSPTKPLTSVSPVSSLKPDPASGTSQTTEISSASSTPPVTTATTPVTTKTPTGHTVPQSMPTSTHPLTPEVTSDNDTSSVQPITARDGMTSALSKPGSPSTVWENDVSPTDGSGMRTVRSTSFSSSSSSSSRNLTSSPTTQGHPATPTTSTATTSTTSTTTTTFTTTNTSASTSTTSALPDVDSADSVSSGPSPSGSPSPHTPHTPSSAAPGTDHTPEDDPGTSHPQPYPEGHPYPEPGSGGQDGRMEGGEEEPMAEPGPDWDNAKMVWREAWELHLYVFCCLFSCVGVYTLVCVVRLWRIHRLLSRRYFVSLNLLMLLLCASRAVYLAVDGYNSNGTFHPSVDYFLYSITFPCLTSAFSIQLYALLQATKMQFLPPTIQKMSVLVTVVVVHFALSLVTDVVVGVLAGMQIMLFVCQLFFILWGLLLFAGYAYIFRRLYLQAVKRQKNVVLHQHAQGAGGGGGGGGGLVKPKPKFTLSVAVKVTFCTAMLGVVTVCLEVYGVVGVYRNFSEERPQPWPWFLYHTALRLVEVLMCATISFVASQPFRYRAGGQACCCPVLCAPCAEMLCQGPDLNPSDLPAAWSQMDHHLPRSSLDRRPPPDLTLDPDLPRPHSKASPRGGGDLLVTASKARICFSDQDDVRPIVTSQPGSRPTSDSLDKGRSSGPDCSPTPDHNTTSTTTPTPTLKTGNGVVNTAYTATTDEVQTGVPAGGEVKSRKSSIASSELFLAPSLSLADSMVSELDRAFRSMHDRGPSLTSLPQHPLHGQPVQAPSDNGLRRSRSAFGRSSFCDGDDPLRSGTTEEEEEGGGRRGVVAGEAGGAWHRKLFRSGSDHVGGVRTKDVANATYMSLLDIEQCDVLRDASTPPARADAAHTPPARADAAHTPPARADAAHTPPARADAAHDAPRLARRAVEPDNDVSNSGLGVNPLCSQTPPSRPTRDVKGVMTSAQAPFRTVISVGSGGSLRDSKGVGDRGGDTPPSFTTSPFSPPPFSGSPSLFRSCLTSSPHGLMGYGNALDDEEDDIEV
ncbi:uncharacterized protein LOC143284613 [Babylonia areolata]|uniref:uncharacterized protein LOC143284613 n=1 Tax=Babylonia areolata TaxID=304850 RepID=UPI003FCF47D3